MLVGGAKRAMLWPPITRLTSLCDCRIAESRTTGRGEPNTREDSQEFVHVGAPPVGHDEADRLGRHGRPPRDPVDGAAEGD